MAKRSTTQIGIALLSIGSLFVLTSCKRNVRIADYDLRHPEVKTVTHYGITLDEKATPKQAAFVVLRAIREDALAKTDEERQRALDVQFDVCAANELAARNMTSWTREEFLFDIVNHWTPTVSHYANDLETEWQKAKPRLVATVPQPAKGSTPNAMACHVLMELRDPGGDASAQVVLVVGLVQDKGFWRVLRLSYDHSKRSIVRRSAVKEPVKADPAAPVAPGG